MKLKKSQIKELIRHTIVDLTEKTFGSKAQYDAYRKKHNLKPGSKHKVDGKTVTVRDVKNISKSAAKSADKFAASQNAKLDAAEKAMKKKKVKDSKGRRFTVKEVRMWMKKLEENRYKKVYNSDARRVAWMVNNEGRTLDEMPISMKKKWSKAQYGRERYLATEFLKSKSEQMTEGKLTDISSKAVQGLKDKKGNMWDYHWKLPPRERYLAAFNVPDYKLKDGVTKINIVDFMTGKGKFNWKKEKNLMKQIHKINDKLKIGVLVDEGKLTSEQKLREQIREIIKEQLNEAITGSDRKILFILVREIVRNLKSKIKNFDVNNKSHLNRVGSSILAIIRAMSYSPDNVNYKNFKKYFPKNFNSKLIQKKLKQFHSQNDKVQVTLVTQAIKNELGAGVNEEKLSEQKLMKILLNKKDMSKLQKAMKKYPFKSLPKFKQKGNDIELNVPKKEYNKAVEFLMKNKLNPRG